MMEGEQTDMTAASSGPADMFWPLNNVELTSITTEHCVERPLRVGDDAAPWHHRTATSRQALELSLSGRAYSDEAGLAASPAST